MNSARERLNLATLGLDDGRAEALRLGDGVVKLGVRMARFLPWHPGKLGGWTRGRSCRSSSRPLVPRLVAAARRTIPQTRRAKEVGWL